VSRLLDFANLENAKLLETTLSGRLVVSYIGGV
jgi:hypothetical protein